MITAEQTVQGPIKIEEREILLVFSRKAELNEAVESLGLGAIGKRESGEPFFVDSPYFVSFTHKGDVGVAALSASKVGVDMENVTIPRNVERLSRLFDESEAPKSLYDFYKVWTAKEAMGKLLGTGITFELLKERITSVRHVEIGDYIIAVAGEGEIRIKEML